MDEQGEFEQFVRRVEPRLRQAMVGRVGPTAAPDAVAEALTYAWQHWPRVSAMANPEGYLYRTAISRARQRRLRPDYPTPEPVRLPDIDPRLPAALASLSERQRVTVFLVVACDWSHHDVADWLDISESSVRNHLRRGLDRLRKVMEVPTRA